MKTDMDRNRRIPKEFYESFVKAQSESENAWEEAKEKADFSVFAPHLQKIDRYDSGDDRLHRSGKRSLRRTVRPV